MRAKVCVDGFADNEHILLNINNLVAKEEDAPTQEKAKTSKEIIPDVDARNLTNWQKVILRLFVAFVEIVIIFFVGISI